MAFWVKIKNLKTENDYTIESLYEAIKDTKFEAGEAQLVKHGFANIIVFPPLDSQNQVWVMLAGKKKISIQKSSQQAGVENVALNAVKDKLTGGLFSFGAVAGKKSKRCEELVDITYREMEKLAV